MIEGHFSGSYSALDWYYCLRHDCPLLGEVLAGRIRWFYVGASEQLAKVVRAEDMQAMLDDLRTNKGRLPLLRTWPPLPKPHFL